MEDEEKKYWVINVDLETWQDLMQIKIKLGKPLTKVIPILIEEYNKKVEC